MEEPRKQRYLDKLSRLKLYYRLLKEWFEASTLEELKERTRYKDFFAIYHSVQLSVEVIIDVCAMIVKDIDYRARDNYTNYEIIAREKIIDRERPRLQRVNRRDRVGINQAELREN
ncbi:MAG: HepT-like ribonuclease domain-containing protein [Promethearchaeota archaeon]